MRYLKYIALLLLFSTIACEKDIEIKPNEVDDLLVVEGHIEPGLPPYVILTKSQTFFSGTDVGSLSDLFVSGADIKVSDGSRTVVLQEFSTDSLPQPVLDTLSEYLGIPLSSPSDPDGFSAVFYTTFEMFGVIGGKYDLVVNAEGKQLSASTTIPQPSFLDSVWTVPNPRDDTLKTLYVRYSDPGGEDNFVRYFTSTNGDIFFPPYFTSTLDDKTYFNVDGKTFDIPLEKGHFRYDDIDFDTYTYFSVDDTIILRWCTIDRAHFRFWSTAEFSRNNGGNPFSSPTQISTNINGGLGVWGGYSPSYYVVEP